jgi:hypothetical protein
VRHIQVAAGLRLRFPQRSEEFDEGVQIGILAGLMESGRTEFSRQISSRALEQARALAQKMGYRILERPGDPESRCVTFLLAGLRPKLELVRSDQFA